MNQPLNSSLNRAIELPEHLFIFSHLRWDFVYQRPQHLATRIAKHCQVYYVEEPVFDAGEDIHYETLWRDDI